MCGVTTNGGIAISKPIFHSSLRLLETVPPSQPHEKKDRKTERNSTRLSPGAGAIKGCLLINERGKVMHAMSKVLGLIFSLKKMEYKL